MRARGLAALAALALAGCAAPELDSGITGRAMSGPHCPVETEPPDPACADRPYPTRLAVTTPDDARVVREFDTDADARFRVALGPGEYAIRSAAAANVRPYCSSEGSFVVAAHAFTEVAVHCDTGIR